MGNHNGTLSVLSRLFKPVQTWKAHETGSITHIKYLESLSLLVTVAEDMSSDPVLKVWSMGKLDQKTDVPRCLSTISLQNNKRQFPPISAFATLDDLSQLAVGFANGAVTVVRGDLIHDRGTKQRTVFESEEPITGIQFREGKTTALYISTTARILTLSLAGRGQGTPARTLDEKGCAVGCMVIDKSTRDVIVARDDALYYYHLYGRSAIYNCDGQKSSVSTHKDYVTLVTPSATSSIAKSTLASPNGVTSRSSTLLILNTDFRYIAHLETLPYEIGRCFEQWGEFFILTLDGKIFRYHEKPLNERLDLLYDRQLFVLAIQIAQKAGVSTAQQNVIFRRYGDYLYQKKDYDTAMQQYLRAIDNTEHTHVIRKYLGTQQINNLVAYLEELHDHDKATSDHTILLLNCYAKLKNVEKLEAFIKAPREIKFDLDTAISMCRQSGYFSQAAYLARKYSEHDIVVSILVEDLKKYAEALAYIWRLEPDSAYFNLSKYAAVLLEHCPEDATQLFIDYYTGKFQPKKDAVIVTEVPASRPATSFATSAVQNLAVLLPLPYMSLDSSARPSSSDKQTETRVVESVSEDPVPVYDIPKPRTAFTGFLDHPEEFRTFLEACVASKTLKDEDEKSVYTALLEMYLQAAQKSTGAEKEGWEQKARDLIKGKDTPMDPSNVLLLSDLAQFRDGTILVREQQGLRLDIFRSYTSANDTAGAIKALHRYGPEEPQLYSAALAYFTSSEQVLQDAGPEFDKVLRKIDEDGLMSPLQIIQTLSTNSTVKMGLVKKYLETTIGRERDEIARNRRLIATFRADSATKRAQLEHLNSEPQTLKATSCSSCGYALDQPSVHYMCEHSYHQRCLNIAEGETVETVECPKCAPQNKNIRALKAAQEEYKDRHEYFKQQLDRSKDKFATIAEWYGRGVMSVPTD